MEREFCAEILRSKRTKTMSNIYKLDRKVESHIDHEYAAEQEQTTIKLECVSEDEQEYDIFATTDESFLTSLKMTCSDSEDPFGVARDGCVASQTSHTDERPGTTPMPSVVNLPNGKSMEESTAIEFMNIFRSLSKQIAAIHSKIDRVQQEVANNSERLGRVEKKVSNSLTTLEKVKNVIVLLDENSGNQLGREMRDNNSPAPRFELKTITNEAEFTEFDTKLGNDKEYYSYMKKGIRMKIYTNEPDNRMHEAMDIIFDRSFLPLCSWTGHGAAGPKIAFGARTNILKLFADIGSNTFVTVNELFVETFLKNKLRHAKQRVNLQGIRKTGCRKRKIIDPSVTPAEEQS